MLVRELAHARAGDKGNTSNVTVVANDTKAYQLLEAELTASVVERELAPLITGSVERYELPTLGAFNFVLDGALAGGVTSSLRVDAHGKSLSYAVLGIDLDGDAAYGEKR